MSYRFDNGATFAQRVDVPVIYTNDSGAGNPDDGRASGVGDVFIEEIFESPEIAKNLRLKASVRFPHGQTTAAGRL